MGSSPITSCRIVGKTAYIRPKVVGPFPKPGASGSYVHLAWIWMPLLFKYKLMIVICPARYSGFLPRHYICFPRLIMFSYAVWIADTYMRRVQ
jgi:hypothetical protein